MPWWLWVVIGVLALAGEAASMALFLLNVGVAAFIVAVLAALLPVAAAAQIAVFVILSVLLIGLVRPRLIHALTGRVPHRFLTNQGMLVDRVAVVTHTVTAGSGTIRIGNGEFWTARVMPPAERIEEGSLVRIAYVDGLTAYVMPVPPASIEAPLASGASGSHEMAREEG